MSPSDSVIFLDIDGVLNRHEWDAAVMCGQIHRDKVQLLNDVLRATGAKIVLSSAWRYILYRGEMDLMGLEWLFRSHGMLADRLIGVTRKDTMVRPTTFSPETWPQHNERGQQIADWRTESGHAGPYVVVDDLDLGISDAGHPFVLVEGDVGLTAADAAEMIQLLSRVEAVPHAD